MPIERKCTALLIYCGNVRPASTMPFNAMLYSTKLSGKKLIIILNSLPGVTKQPLTCPEKVVALTSPESSLASFKLQFGDQKHVIRLPLGRYSYSMKSSNKDCNISLLAEGKFFAML